MAFQAPGYFEVWLLPSTLLIMLSIFTQCDIAAHGHHMWSFGQVLKATLFICVIQSLLRFAERQLQRAYEQNIQQQQQQQSARLPTNYADKK